MTNDTWFDMKRRIETCGFVVYRGNDNYFVIQYGRQDRVVSFGAGVKSRAWDAMRELRPDLADAA